MTFPEDSNGPDFPIDSDDSEPNGNERKDSPLAPNSRTVLEIALGKKEFASHFNGNSGKEPIPAVIWVIKSLAGRTKRSPVMIREILSTSPLIQYLPPEFDLDAAIEAHRHVARVLPAIPRPRRTFPERVLDLLAVAQGKGIDWVTRRQIYLATRREFRSADFQRKELARMVAEGLITKRMGKGQYRLPDPDLGPDEWPEPPEEE